MLVFFVCTSHHRCPQHHHHHEHKRSIIINTPMQAILAPHCPMWNSHAHATLPTHKTPPPQTHLPCNHTQNGMMVYSGVLQPAWEHTHTHTHTHTHSRQHNRQALHVCAAAATATAVDCKQQLDGALQGLNRGIFGVKVCCLRITRASTTHMHTLMHVQSHSFHIVPTTITSNTITTPSQHRRHSWKKSSRCWSNWNHKTPCQSQCCTWIRCRGIGSCCLVPSPSRYASCWVGGLLLGVLLVCGFQCGVCWKIKAVWGCHVGHSITFRDPVAQSWV